MWCSHPRKGPVQKVKACIFAHFDSRRCPHSSMVNWLLHVKCHIINMINLVAMRMIRISQEPEKSHNQAKKIANIPPDVGLLFRWCLGSWLQQHISLEKLASAGSAPCNGIIMHYLAPVHSQLDLYIYIWCLLFSSVAISQLYRTALTSDHLIHNVLLGLSQPRGIITESCPILELDCHSESQSYNCFPKQPWSLFQKKTCRRIVDLNDSCRLLQ